MLFLLIPLASCLGPPVAAARGQKEVRKKPKPHTRRIESTGAWAFKRLARAQKALGDGDTAAAMVALDEMKARVERLSAHEQAMMWQTYAYAYSTQEKYEQATQAFEKCLALNALPEQAVINAHYNLAQLYMVEENFPKAIEHFEIWFKAAENPSADAHYMMAAAYTQAGRPKSALPHAKSAVAGSPVPKEAWLELLLSLYFQLDQHREAVGVLRKLIASYPKKPYWMQLAATYTELDDKKKALATMELAEEQGYLTSENEVRNLVQLYLNNGIPYRAAQTIEKAMEDGRLPRTSKNEELLANTLLNARERERAIEPLEKAAALSDDGNLYVRLGQVHMAEERWGAARIALRKALQKGDVRHAGNVYLMIGIANASESRWPEAKKAFRAAQKYSKSAKSASQWLDHIEDELTLDAYEEQLEPATEGGASAAGGAAGRSS